jgi:Zn-dependent peptidase ImmA (M78 family)
MTDPARHAPSFLRVVSGSRYTVGLVPSQVKNEAAQDAEKLLAAAWSGGVPVDPVAIARRVGLRVLYAPMEQETMGALIKRPGEDPTILINQEDSENRKRFTCAHELGHFVRRKDEADEYHRTDYRNAVSSTGTDPEEIYANEFAASLLMPVEDVKLLMAAGLSDLELALKFKVSREAVEHRLTNLFVSQ